VKHRTLSTVLLATVTLLAGCSGSAKDTEANGEPTEAALRSMLEKSYDAISTAGGMNVTVTASGKNLNLKPKLHEMKKVGCKAMKLSKDTSYECSVDAIISINGGKPGKHGERLQLKKNAKGEWIAGF